MRRSARFGSRKKRASSLAFFGRARTRVSVSSTIHRAWGSISATTAVSVKCRSVGVYRSTVGTKTDLGLNVSPWRGRSQALPIVERGASVWLSSPVVSPPPHNKMVTWSVPRGRPRFLLCLVSCEVAVLVVFVGGVGERSKPAQILALPTRNAARGANSYVCTLCTRGRKPDFPLHLLFFSFRARTPWREKLNDSVAFNPP